MWPLSGRDVATACGVSDLAPSAADVSLAGVCLGERPPRADELFVALREGGSDGHDVARAQLEAGAPLALVSSDWAGLRELPAELRARCLVATDANAAFRALAGFMRARFPFPVVAVGGSNGKTTVKDMLAAMLSGGGRRATSTRETMNGWTGLPYTLVQRAHAARTPPDALVCEIGIDEVSAMADHARLCAPDVCVLTALGPEHLAGLGDAETAAREELVLFEVATGARRVFQAADVRLRAALDMAREGDLVVCPAEDARPLDRRDLTLGLLTFEVASESPTSTDVTLSYFPAGAREPAFRGALRVPMPGLHNGANAALAFGAGLALGRDAGELVRGFRAFTPPTMRCQVHELAGDTVLVDDAYNASPESMRAALELLLSPAWSTRPLVLVLGDMLDLGDASPRYHEELALALRPAVERGATLRLVGDALSTTHRALLAATPSAKATHFPEGTPPEALLLGLALEGAVVLVKGSRGMHLEHVTAELRRRSDAAQPFQVTGREDDLPQFYGRFTTAAVTGTNGKTTTTSLIAAIVGAAGELPCRVTTLGAWVGDETTGEEPTGEAFVETLARAAIRGVKTLAVETTSHALAQGFTKTWPAKVAVFTNLSRDHLDYHGSPEEYLAAKAQLFMDLPADGVAVLNAADPASALLFELLPEGVRCLTYAARPVAAECAALTLDLVAESVVVDPEGTHVVLAPSPLARDLGGRLDLSLLGLVHAENALGAALAGVALGYAPPVIARALRQFRGVPGRFQVVSRRPLVVVDFAHTPDALERTLVQARGLVEARGGRVLVAFGCGGDRDPGKRAEMGEIASRRADVVCLTTDNPRGEDPEKIADAVEVGTKAGTARLIRIPDRALAIAKLVELSALDDIVVIAGKGHEKTQIVGDTAFPFDDADVAENIAAKRGSV